MSPARFLLLTLATGSLLLACGPGPGTGYPGYVPPTQPGTGPQGPGAVAQRMAPAVITAWGEDFQSPRFDPTRIGKPLDEIDTTYDYDFAELSSAGTFLEGVPRKQALLSIFDEVTDGAATDTDRHLAILRFLQEASVHSGYLQPMYPDRTMVTDPLLLLYLNEMRCGHVARVAVDLFDAAGYPGRVVQLAGHIVAEISYGGSWHYLDADVFGGGLAARDPGGSFPSLAELSEEPSRLDGIGAYSEDAFSPGRAAGAPIECCVPDPSYYYFSTEAYEEAGVPAPYYLYKAGPEVGGHVSIYYGWDHTNIKAAKDITLTSFGLHYQPAAPRFSLAERLATGEIRLAWTGTDGDGDLSGYQVYVGSTSRQWNYHTLVDDPSAASFFYHPGWDSQMYGHLFEPIPHDVQLIATTGTSLTLGPFKMPVFISVTPTDAYGDSLGRTQYFASDELRFLPQ